MLLGLGSRAIAVSNWRNLFNVVWNNTVGRVWSSAMTAPPRRAGAVLPLSTNCTDDTAKTLDGTTRAVTVSGMPAAYRGLRFNLTTLGRPACAGTTPETDPTIAPRNLTSDFTGSPSPTLTNSAVTRTNGSSAPRDFAVSRVTVVAVITKKATPTTNRRAFDGPRVSVSKEFGIYPPNLAPASTPHMAIVSKAFKMTI